MSLLLEKNSVLDQVKKYQKEIEEDLSKVEDSSQKEVLRDNRFVLERTRIKYENDLLVSTGILIPFAFGYLSLTSLFGIYKPLADALSMVFILFYIFYCMAQIKKKGKVINQIYAIEKLIDEI